MGNKASKTSTRSATPNEKKENFKSHWNMLKHVPHPGDYSQPVLVSDSKIIIIPKNINHSDDHRYLMLYDAKTDKYAEKWIKINKFCKLLHNVCISNEDKSKVYVFGGRWYCFLEIDVKKRKITEYIKYGMQQHETAKIYNYHHPGEYAMISRQNNIVHIVGGSESSKHLQFETCADMEPQFQTLCQSLFIGDADASYCEGAIVFNELSGNLIAFGGKRNNDFLKGIWLSRKTEDGVIWNRSRNKDLPQKLHLFGCVLVECVGKIVVIFGGKLHNGNNSNAIFYCRLKEDDEAISFQTLKSLICPFSGPCFAVLDDGNSTIHLFRRQYHYTIAQELVSKMIECNVENEEKNAELSFVEESELKENYNSLVKNPLVILIGIKTYEKSTKLKDLHGAKTDIQAYSSVFEDEYHYKVICQDKFKWVGDEIEEFFVMARKHLVAAPVESLHDGLIVVIAGHGHKDTFIQSDGKQRRLDYYHAFFSCIWNDVIASLKIRLFIVDCCRGSIRDGTVKHHKKLLKSTRGGLSGGHLHVDDLLVSIYGNSRDHQVTEDEFGGFFSQSLIQELKEKKEIPLNRLLQRVKEGLADDSKHRQLVNIEGDQSALFCVLTPNS